MHKIIVVSILFLFLLEDTLQLQTFFKIKFLSRFDKEISNKNRLIGLDFIRLLELLFLGLLLSTDKGNPTTIHGQANVILVGMQFVRCLGKRIIQYQPVLSIVQILQVVSLVTLLALPYSDIPSQNYSSLSTMKLTIFTGIVYAFFCYLSFPFSISFFIKFFSSESSNNFSLLPPIIALEKWCIKLSFYSMFFGLFTAFNLFFKGGISFLSVGFALSLLSQISGIWLARKPIFNGYHIKSHILWSFSALLLYFIAIYETLTKTIPA